MAHYNSGKYGGYKYEAIPCGIRRIGIGSFRPLAGLPYWTGSKPRFIVKFTPLENQSDYRPFINVYIKSPDIEKKDRRLELSQERTVKEKIDWYGVTSDGELVYYIGDSTDPSKDWLVRIGAISNDAVTLAVILLVVGLIIGKVL